MKNCIENQIVESSEIFQQLFTGLKKLYFDIMVNQIKKDKEKGNNYDQNNIEIYNNNDHQQLNFNKLSRPSLAKFLEAQLLSFTKKEKTYISIEHELKPFLHSCGNQLTEEEIEFMVHLIENSEGAKQSNEISLRQLYDIWGAFIYFSSKTPKELIAYIFEKHFEERGEMVNEVLFVILTGQKLSVFFKLNQDYFNKEIIDYVIKEVGYLGKEFSLESFICLISNSIRYHPL